LLDCHDPVSLVKINGLCREEAGQARTSSPTSDAELVVPDSKCNVVLDVAARDESATRNAPLNDAPPEYAATYDATTNDDASTNIVALICPRYDQSGTTSTLDS
jgi:hypothetical protein